MPLMEVKCDTCGHKKLSLKLIAELCDPVPCPACHKEMFVTDREFNKYTRPDLTAVIKKIKKITEN